MLETIPVCAVSGSRCDALTPLKAVVCILRGGNHEDISGQRYRTTFRVFTALIAGLIGAIIVGGLLYAIDYYAGF